MLSSYNHNIVRPSLKSKKQKQTTNDQTQQDIHTWGKDSKLSLGTFIPMYLVYVHIKMHLHT